MTFLFSPYHYLLSDGDHQHKVISSFSSSDLDGVPSSLSGSLWLRCSQVLAALLPLAIATVLSVPRVVVVDDVSDVINLLHIR